MSYSCFIFDFDGTLFDTRRAIAATLDRTLEEAGLPRPTEAALWSTIRRGITLEETFTALLPEREGSRIPDLVIAYRDLYNTGLGLSESRLFEGMDEILMDLAAGPAPVIVCSNKGRLAVERTLERHGVRTAVRFIVAASGPAPTKPDPRSFFDLIRPAIGESESSTPLVIGDTEVDIRYAHGIGADVCWAAYGYGDPALCEPLCPTYVAANHADLRRVLNLPSRVDVRILAQYGEQGPHQAELLAPLEAFRSVGLPREVARAHIAGITVAALGRIGGFLGRSPALVPIARAGMAMWAAADTHFGHPKTVVALARKTKGTSDVVFSLTSGLGVDVTEGVLLLDTVSATGDTIIKAAEEISRRAPGVAIAALVCYASPEAVGRMRTCPQLRRLCVAVLSQSVDEAGWLLPSIGGDAGDKLYGTAA